MITTVKRLEPLTSGTTAELQQTQGTKRLFGKGRGFLKWGACLSFNHQAARVKGGERHYPEPPVSVQGTNPSAALGDLDTHKQQDLKFPELSTVQHLCAVGVFAAFSLKKTTPFSRAKARCPRSRCCRKQLISPQMEYTNLLVLGAYSFSLKPFCGFGWAPSPAPSPRSWQARRAHRHTIETLPARKIEAAGAALG